MNEPNAGYAGSHGTQRAFPARVVFEPPQRFERSQLLLRILVMILLSGLHQPFGGISCALYFILPVVAAVLISQRGGSQFLASDMHWMHSALEWVVGLFAYLMLVTDRIPLGPSQRLVRLEVQPQGTPSVATALFRFFTSLPHLIVLFVLGIISGLIWLYAALSVLFTEQYPYALQKFQRGILAWIARVLVYHGSLVEDYPPFAFDDDGPTHRLLEDDGPASASSEGHDA